MSLKRHFIIVSSNNIRSDVNTITYICIFVTNCLNENNTLLAIDYNIILIHWSFTLELAMLTCYEDKYPAATSELIEKLCSFGTMTIFTILIGNKD